jgi:cell division protein FtsW (lipid II flippase)
MTSPVKRSGELRYLLLVLLIMSVGFLILQAGFVDRGVPETLFTRNGSLDISPFFLNFFPNALYATFFVAIFLLLHVYIRAKIPSADPFILPAVALLTGVGIILLFRLSPDLSRSRNEALLALFQSGTLERGGDNVLSLAQLGMRQFIFFVIGIIGMIVAINFFGKVGISWFSSKKYFWVLLSIVLICITLKFGTTINGRTLWLFGFQTVEVVKLCMLLFIAGYVYEKGKGISVHGGQDYSGWFRHAGPFFVMWFFALAPLFIQRDLGPVMLVFVVFLIMFYYAGNRISVVAYLVLVIGAALYGAYSMGYPSILRQRVDMMLDPFGRNETTARALWSMASGGFYGTGIGYGKPYRIPEVQSDYNFVAICEEMGLAGAFAVMFAYAVLVFRCFVVAGRTSHVYRKTLSTGIGTLIGIQSFIIIAGNLGIIPLTGITLPFVSYGGSSMIMNFVMVGIVLRLSEEDNG